MPGTRESSNVAPMPNVIGLITGHFDQRAGYEAYRPHGTQDWLLILTMAGLGRFELTAGDGKPAGEIIASRGDLVLLRPGTLHRYGVEDSRQHWELLWTHFNPRADWLAWLDWPEESHGVMRLRLGASSGAKKVRSQFLKTHRLATSVRPRRVELAMNALEELLLWCDELNPRSREFSIDPRLRSAMDRIAMNLHREISLDEMAAEASLSTSRFAHLFHEQTGTTPQKFLETLRLERAATLLRMTQLSVKEIAVKVGYSNPFYFTLRFKRQSGVSPRAYRSRA